MSIDLFYPISQTMSSVSSMWQDEMATKLASRRKSAQGGDRDAESQLCNRLGQLRRSVESFDLLTKGLIEEVQLAVTFLRSVGRKVNFEDPDPATWITQRDGSPRWSRQTTELDDFVKLLKSHDWYFQYSDDVDVWRRGEVEWALIQKQVEQDRTGAKAALLEQYRPKR